MVAASPKSVACMTVCPSCGETLEGAACARCAGTESQPPAPPAIDDNVASALCYLLLGVTGVLLLYLEPYNSNKRVRFHAFQGLYLFVAMLLVEWVLTPMFRVIHEPIFRFDKLLQAGILFMCVFMIIKASHEEMYSLPIIGDLAARSAAEN